MPFQRNALLTSVLLVIIVSVASPAFPREAVTEAKTRQPTEPAFEQTMAWLLIDGPPTLRSLLRANQDDEVQMMLGIHEVAAKAGYKLDFGLLPSVVEERIVMMVVLTRQRGAAAEDSQAVFRKVAEQMKHFLTAIADPGSEQKKRQLEEARKLANDTHHEMLQLRVSLRRQRLELAAKGMAPEALEDQLHRSKQEQMSLDVELAGLRARREAVIKHMEECRKDMANDQERPDGELAELRRVLGAREEQLEKVMAAFKAGRLPDSEVSEARARIAELRAQIARRREAKEHDSARGELLTGLTRQLMEIEIETAGAEARLAKINEAAARCHSKKLMESLQTLEALEHGLDSAGQFRERALDKVARLEEQMERFREPKVKLVDRLKGNDKSAKSKKRRKK
jgi:hypothetical protein